jgi:hypothetical protein
MYHLLSRIDDGIRPMLDVLQGYVEAYGIEQLKSLSQDAAKAGVRYQFHLSDIFPLRKIVICGMV